MERSCSASSSVAPPCSPMVRDTSSDMVAIAVTRCSSDQIGEERKVTFFNPAWEILQILKIGLLTALRGFTLFNPSASRPAYVNCKGA